MDVRACKWASSDSALWVKLSFASLLTPVFVASCYFPPASSQKLRDWTLQSRISALSANISSARTEGTVLLAGDFNSRIGTYPMPPLSPGCRFGPAPRGCTDAIVNGHGRSLINFCISKDLTILTGIVKGDFSAAPTFSARSNSCATRLDHVILPSSDVSHVTMCHIDSTRHDSDHLPIGILLDLPAISGVQPELGGHLLRSVKWKSSVRPNYASVITQSLHVLVPSQCFNTADLDSAYQTFSAGLLQKSELAGLRLTSLQTSQRKNAAFYDQECLASKRRVRTAMANGATGSQLKELERQYHLLVRKKRREHKSKQLRDVLSLHHTDPRIFWKRLKGVGTQLPPNLLPVHAWDAFLSSLCKLPNTPAALTLPDHAYPQRPQDPATILNAPIESTELLFTLNRLQNGKAPGPSGIVSELYRYARHLPTPDEPNPPNLLVPSLLSLLNSSFSLGHIPAHVNVSLITPIFKKGDPTQACNYRPIAVSDPILKLYAGILNQRLVNFTEENNYRSPAQTAFRPHLSTLHPTFALQTMIDLAKSKRKTLYCCFLDLKSAYDTVDRPLLWTVLARLGIHDQMLHAIQSLYAVAQYAMKVGGRRGDCQVSITGLKQGCPLSPTLFGIFLDGLTRSLQHHCANAGFRIAPDLLISHLLYADDIVLTADSPQALQNLINASLAFCQQIGLIVSASKTSVACFPRTRSSLSWQCGDACLSPVDCVKYLGLNFECQNGLLSSVSCREAKMWRNWAVLHRLYQNLRCSTSVGLYRRLYRACVPPAASYGCEIWGLRGKTAKMRKSKAAIEQGHVNVLRQISGLRKSTPHCIVFHETEEKPLHHYWLLRTVKFWNNLLQLAPDSIFRGVLLSLVLSAETFSEGWFFDFLQALRSIGYGPLPCLGDLTAVVEYDVQCLLMQSLNKPFTPALQSIVPRQLFTPGIVLCTYFHWFRPPARKFASCSPISLPLPAKLVRTFLRFRSGCSGLPIDTGRVTRIPRAARVCLACLSGSLCDEQHLVFECPALASLRHQYTCLFRPGTVTMQTFLWQKDIVLVAKFVFEAMAILTGNLWSCMLGNCLGYSLLNFARAT